MQRKKYGYLGYETALNGLTSWLQDRLQFKGTTDARYNECLRIIVAYAVENIPEYAERGHLHTKADYIAKKIQRNNKFSHFSDWAKEHYDLTNTIY